jgi:hypothetical protein
MNPNDRNEIVDAVERVAELMARWHLGVDDWCVLDGPAIKLHDPEFEASPWRDHLNIYVRERALPWDTSAFELTMPPTDSAELQDLLRLARAGIQVHLVPASKYYQAGFDRSLVLLPSGKLIEAATLRGCAQMWSYKSAEVVENPSEFEGDTERITSERVGRLNAALAATVEDDVRARLLLLLSGYEALGRRAVTEASRIFEEAAGPDWIKLRKPHGQAGTE